MNPHLPETPKTSSAQVQGVAVEFDLNCRCSQTRTGLCFTDFHGLILFFDGAADRKFVLGKDGVFNRAPIIRQRVGGMERSIFSTPQ